MDNTLATPAITLRHYALVFGVCLLLWVLLVGNLDAQELLAGVLVSALITLLFGSRFGILTGFRFSLLAPVYMLVYLGNFMVALVRANLDLALRVISLTPGTLTVDVIDDTLLVHWVNCPPGTDMQQATEKIAAAFEKNLGRFLL